MSTHNASDTMDRPDEVVVTMRVTRSELASRGRKGAATRIQRGDDMTGAARATLEARWRQVADPDASLSPEELQTAVRRLRSEFYRRAAAASHAARQKTPAPE